MRDEGLPQSICVLAVNKTAQCCRGKAEHNDSSAKCWFSGLLHAQSNQWVLLEAPVLF
jgi:hypothetical protein